MKYIQNFEANFTDKIKDIFKNDIYYINKDDYNYTDGFSRYFKNGDIVVYYNEELPKGFSFLNGFNNGDKCKILKMKGQNAKVLNKISDKIEVVSLNNLLKEEDYYLNINTKKYNI